MRLWVRLLLSIFQLLLALLPSQALSVRDCLSLLTGTHIALDFDFERATKIRDNAITLHIILVKSILQYRKQ